MRLVDQVRLIPTDRKRKPRTCNNLQAEYQLLKSGRKVRFNSPIQHDFIVMCDFAPEVETVLWQPFSLSFYDLVTRERRRYTPDYLVETIARSGKRYTYLAEVTRHCENSRPTHRGPRGDQARAHMAAVEWARSQPLAEMVIITEHWIRSRGIENVKRIQNAASLEVSELLREIILSTVLTKSGVTLGQICDAALSKDYEAAQVMASVLRLCHDDHCHFDIGLRYDVDTVIYAGSRSRIFRF